MTKKDEACEMLISAYPEVKTTKIPLVHVNMLIAARMQWVTRRRRILALLDPLLLDLPLEIIFIIHSCLFDTTLWNGVKSYSL